MPATPPAANPFAALTITGNPTVDAVIRYGLVAALATLTGIITGWLNAHGFTDPNLSLLISGALVSLLSAAALALWGVIRTSKIKAITDAERVLAMNATLQLVASGKALDTSGNVISSIAPGSTPPKPITVATATEIVKNFAPSKPKEG